MHKRPLRHLLLLQLALLVSASVSAQAQSLSITSTLAPDNPNDVFIVEFELANTAALNVQTWGYGGTGAAPGGTNAWGTVVPAGGFDPYVSLFAGTGADATFVASNDDGLCPEGTPFPACADSTLLLTDLPAGHYTLALTLPFNYSFAENQGSGTLGDGFIGLDASFDDGACAGLCSNAFAVDIASTALVPEPAPLRLMLTGGLAGWLLRRRFVSRTR